MVEPNSTFNELRSSIVRDRVYLLYKEILELSLILMLHSFNLILIKSCFVVMFSLIQKINSDHRILNDNMNKLLDIICLYPYTNTT